MSKGSDTQKALWREARRHWLQKEDNREKDREAARLRYWARKRDCKATFEQLRLPVV